MPSNTETEKLRKLERLVGRVIRKSLKDNTLDYTVQMTVSSLEPGKVQYAALISSPAKGVQPITFVYDTYELLEAALKESVEGLDPRKVEVAFHENRINSYKNKIDQHQERVDKLNDPNYKPEDDLVDEDIPMEAV